MGRTMSSLEEESWSQALKEAGESQQGVRGTSDTLIPSASQCLQLSPLLRVLRNSDGEALESEGHRALTIPQHGTHFYAHFPHLNLTTTV